ncbi:restriction endonuclease subunit S [Prevotella copri]|uniref:Restriction endonuclease subunit S n=1 Tax=Segatella copri TaxID=165179 RepID=A0AAW5ICX2_9BACT|nr:restriction endonuclease subunit S [Segatella copri]MCP9503026.1 restriction endonuclease subunit S [Segatella copri]MCP9505983.1 restriction endonuclease subunit S [Segatella copri]MCP9524062.1 restriction endonuclease subunit S [Segatella copri]MCP9550769.1 restriction endonuclease subunit S [Segatella copri]MCP9615719.1 restriction endonuclease subunit S [Segatella copri]
MSSYYEKILATGEVKCIDEEVPFEIPKGWEWCRLNDLALYRKGPFGSSLTKSMFVAKSNQSVKVYEQKNAIQKDFRLGDYYISKEKFEAMQSFIVKPNDIIVSCAGTIGETYLLPLDAPIGIINQALMRVTLFDLSMAEYWQMYFAYTLLNEAQMKGAGSAIKNIPPFEYLKAVLVPVPPLSEQTRLVERYNLLLSLIAKYESEADKLNCLNLNIYDKLKKTVLQEAIQGKLVQQIAEEGTAQELLEQIKTEKQNLVKEGKLKKSALNDSVIFRGDDNRYYEKIGKKCVDITEEIPFEIPNSWTWARMGGIGDWGAGSTPQRTNQNYYGGNILWLKTGELNNGIVYDTEEKITQKAFQDCSLRMNKIGDVLIAMYGATIGKLAIVGKELTTNQACCGCTPYIIFNWYLFYFLMASRDTFIKKGEGGAQPNISRVKLVEHLIPLPPLREQKRIVQKIEQLMKLLK